MSAQPLFVLLEKLLKLHKSLYQLALEKTEVLKKGDLEALQTLMKNEQSHVIAIRKIEDERVKMISELLPDHEDPTLRDCLPLFEKAEAEQIKSLQESLMEQLFELKTINELNQQLLEQSLQFVSLNIDLLIPESPTNYSKDEEANRPSVTLFDSKA
ncbi:flagellar protein FlgN [Bacillus sp. DTU_2020_1000418_1_SI_GHA_SEK_038]|uniref:flagellar protein FlgN n=1 Tax=Bacillus sp. DTU_2020_1000418_1_SI_GHA_SEK_038 TaxID=3077585 RepID=UPI0028E912A2|nr:flagellar protein FlgN [Bacillus sp. DTU_2020_1000418_1_SI_GHA_SEK_038]WNS75091.1 flagellar protein FlgN [Bacillus sp. DTU_2020_1000418_1_SI_GHA_SEK_038]